MDKAVTSGVHPNNTYPLVDGELDPEQKRRQAAREDSERARNRGSVLQEATPVAPIVTPQAETPVEPVPPVEPVSEPQNETPPSQ